MLHISKIKFGNGNIKNLMDCKSNEQCITKCILDY